MSNIKQYVPNFPKEAGNRVYSEEELQGYFGDQSLEGSNLDPMTLLSGGGAANVVKNSSSQYGKYLRYAKNNSKEGVSPEGSRRLANISLLAGLGKAADPTTIPRAFGDMIGMGTKGGGLDSFLVNSIGNVSKASNNLARIRNYRMNKVAGNDTATSLLMDRIATRKQQAFSPVNNANSAFNIIDNPFGNIGSMGNMAYKLAGKI